MASADGKETNYIYIPVKIGPDASQSWSIRLAAQGLPTMLGKATSKLESGNQYAVDLVRPGSTFTFSQALQNQSDENLPAVPVLPRTTAFESRDSSEESHNCRTHFEALGTDTSGTCGHGEKSVDSNATVQSNSLRLEEIDDGKWKKAQLSSVTNDAHTDISPQTSIDTFVNQNSILAAHDARTCVSPESGIDCDDVHSPSQIIFHEEQSFDIKSPAIQHDACVSSLVLDVEKFQDVSEERKEDVGTTNTTECVSSRTCIAQESVLYSCSSTTTSNTHEQASSSKSSEKSTAQTTLPEISDREARDCENAGNSMENEDCDDLQIISVHSLATSSPGFSECFLKDIAKSTNTNSLLPGCKRLYIRNIRTSSHGSKLVLVVESDYSRARPLPSWISNKPTKKKTEIEPIPRDKHEEDIVEVKMKRNFFEVTPKKEIPRKKNCCVLHHEKAPSSSTSVKKVFPKKGRSFGNTPIKKIRGRSYAVKIENTDNFEDRFKTNDLENCNFNENFVGDGVRTRNGSRNTTSTPAYVPKVDRISQLREKLRQKEADLEKIRKTMNSFDDAPLG